MMRPARLVLAGGDTAGMVLARMGVRALRVVAEVQPGMALCRARDEAGTEWETVLKAGSHGEPDALVRLMGGAVQ
jgi:uncharacterized protein YgbK (DUF1537 family)